MLELHQFRHSPFCLKVRMALAAKKLKYRTVEITPAIGQIDIFQKTGQRKLPVLFDNEIIIHNSSSIIRHLEKIQIEPKLIPDNPKERSQAQIIENWADTTLANSIKIVFLEEILKNPELISSLLPNQISGPMQKFLINMPLDIGNQISGFINQKEKESLRLNLDYITNLIEKENFIIGKELSLADISVASQLSLLSFPTSSGETLKGKGCSIYINDPSLKNLFKWRDSIENKLISINHHQSC